MSYLLQLALKNKDEKTLWTKNECDKNGITELFSKIMTEYKSLSPYSDISTKILASQILLAILRDTENTEISTEDDELSDENLARRIYNATMYINSHFSEDISANDCAKNLFMSYSYFSRSFKRIMGMSFRDYLNHARINRAETALMSTDKPVNEIAAACGFNNTSYFISIYKKIKGMTPTAFRSGTHCGKP
jgi:YesN/AraC family two-component response regulator